MTPVVDFPPPSPVETWLEPCVENIPALLRSQARWLRWTRDSNGRKVPRTVANAHKNADATDPRHWARFEEVVAAPPLSGFGFALGSVEGGPTFGGVDLDDCRNPRTGEIEPWARDVIRALDTYAEVSPSGTGVKVFLLGALPEGSTQGKVHQLEIYDRDRYFAVTGHHLPGTPATVEARELQLRALYARQRSHDLAELTKLFGLYRGDHGEWVDIACPWREEHSQPDDPRDAALHRDKDGQIDGFHCFHASHADTKKLPDVLKLFGLKGTSGFIENKNGTIVANSQANIRRALGKLGVSLRRDLFAQKFLVTSGDRTETLDDATAVLLWLEIDERFSFRPSKEFFIDVAQDIARKNPFHPVRDYLTRVTWDGTPRLDAWLVTYGKAKDTPLNRAIGAIVLIAAVRRVRQPGCKFDELLVLISPQGSDKSSALRALCPDDDWFSDDLPLNVDAKQIIERTAGKWILEAAELTGLGKREADHLKASLSRQVDGPVRMAYARLAVEVPRQFVTVGTTNSHQFLKDRTGNRRFWPVAVQTFDVAAIRRDRDQLWAEAAQREARGESIRLDPSLYANAAREQDARQIDDPWRAVICDLLNLDEEGRPKSLLPQAGNGGLPKGDRLRVETVWKALQISIERRDERAAERVNAIMQSLGYEKKQMRGFGDDTDSAKRWCRVVDLPETDHA